MRAYRLPVRGRIKAIGECALHTMTEPLIQQTGRPAPTGVNFDSGRVPANVNTIPGAGRCPSFTDKMAAEMPPPRYFFDVAVHGRLHSDGAPGSARPAGAVRYSGG